MQEVQAKRSVDVAFRAAEERDIVVCRVDEADTGHLDNGRLLRGLCCDDLVAEVHDFISTLQQEQVN